MTVRDTSPPVPLTLDDLSATGGDPGCVWDKLRERGPVHRIMTPEGAPAWLVTRYPDVRAGLLEPRLSVRKDHARGGDYKGFALPEALDAHLLNRDPPDHTRLRELIAPMLQPRTIDPFRAQIEGITGNLIANFAGAGKADLVADLAVPLPLLVVCALLGVSDRDTDRLLGWARELLVAGSDEPPRARDTVSMMLRIVNELIADRRATPRDDVVTALVRSRDARGALTEHELTSMLFYILFVWYEISVDLIAGGLLTLLRHLDRLGDLRDRPERIPAAVEELLRHQTPQFLAAPRFPVEDITIAGVPIPAGDSVLLCLASADRDPTQFPNTRWPDIDGAPPAHLAFGLGIHTCLGAPLVRMHTQIVIAALLRHCPRLRLAAEVAQLRWQPGLRHTSLRTLPVVF